MLAEVVEQDAFIIDGICANAEVGAKYKDPKFYYGMLMDIVRQQINDYGLRPAHWDAQAFALVPFFAWDLPCTHLENVAQGWAPRALDNAAAYGLINFPQSSNRSEGGNIRGKKWSRGTFLHFAAEYATGKRNPKRCLRRKVSLHVAGAVTAGERNSILAVTDNGGLNSDEPGDHAAAILLKNYIILGCITVFLQPREHVHLLPICGLQLCGPHLPLEMAFEHVVWKTRFRRVLWGKAMLDLLENVLQTRHKAYGFIGRMDDWIECLPVQKPMHYADIEQRDALILIVLELVESKELSCPDYSVMKKELLKRMPSYDYSLRVCAAQTEFLNRVPVGFAHLGMVSGNNSAID